MKKEVKERYENCVRFDEGQFCRAQEYLDLVHKKCEVQELIINMFGSSITPLLEEYAGLFYEEMELEAQHYFEQGFCACQ